MSDNKGNTRALTPPEDDPEAFQRLHERQEQQPRPADVPSSPRTVLIVFDNNPNSLQFELDDDAILGRHSEGSAQQPDIDLAPYGGFPAGVSRLHVRIRRTEDHQLVLEDLNSRNGTFVDGQQLAPGEECLVGNGQSVRFGGLFGWIFFEGLKR